MTSHPLWSGAGRSRARALECKHNAGSWKNNALLGCGAQSVVDWVVSCVKVKKCLCCFLKGDSWLLCVNLVNMLNVFMYVFS